MRKPWSSLRLPHTDLVAPTQNASVPCLGLAIVYRIPRGTHKDLIDEFFRLHLSSPALLGVRDAA